MGNGGTSWQGEAVPFLRVAGALAYTGLLSMGFSSGISVASSGHPVGLVCITASPPTSWRSHYLQWRASPPGPGPSPHRQLHVGTFSALGPLHLPLGS